MRFKDHWLKLVLLLILTAVALAGCNNYNDEETTGETEAESEEPAENNSSDSEETAENSNFNADVFNFATNQDIPHLDPHGSAANTSFRVTYMMYDRLVTYEGTSTEPQPMLAKEWDISDDGLEYTFYLEEEATFHDGSPVTADAVAYSYTRAIELGKSAAGIFNKVLDPETSFEVIDEHTIKIKLKKPFAPFISTLGTVFGNILNPNLEENHGDDYGESFLAETEVGSGPYILESWDRGETLVLKANPDYWGEAPTMETVNIRFVSEPSTARLMLEKGEIDLIDNTMISPEVLGQMEGTEGLNIQKSTGYQIDYMPMNIESGVLSDVLVRQAIAHSINYDALLESVYLGEAERIGGAVPAGMFGYNPDAKLYDYDLDKAKALLEEGGYEEGEINLEIAISEDNEVRSNTALLLQSDLSKVGINLEIKTYAWPTFLDLVTNGEHDFGLVSWTPDYPDPDYNLWYFGHSDSKGPGFNLAFYENSDVDALLEEARSNTDEALRAENYEEIQNVMAEEVPYIFVAQPNLQAPVRDWVQGYELNPMNTWYVPFDKITKVQ
ncbi:ABC transporter substrate-binding protein [Aquibacillus koreensis]|uniref:ABC transporter substrate-binding protein n=1 Tax=Aquibacillus koreensis TaxID=279446 RepID=A0A9X3WJ83_9BACI|nr:ABC transporter substrate-binding protein [Aquibacillus koreensis]MCT2537094.1 ABC transporter substrate-binding protein [Aquibacillus koreensis]MDC3419923.1 ABC transporter substrate-binding protein [Aquibacillus koreensis]